MPLFLSGNSTLGILISATLWDQGVATDSPVASANRPEGQLELHSLQQRWKPLTEARGNKIHFPTNGTIYICEPGPEALPQLSESGCIRQREKP